MKKILLTWANGMLATDFVDRHKNDFEIFSYDKNTLDIMDIESIENKVKEIHPDIILNCAAYTAVDDAEDIWKLLNYHINTLGVYNLAKISNTYAIDFITFSTDYVFDGKKESWYNENDICNPINEYGMSKYLWEIFALKENKNAIIVRTSWLYGWWKEFKNFVNTILRLSETKSELKVINEQFWNPTYTVDLSLAVSQVIKNIEKYRGSIFHFSNETENNDISWFDFACEIITMQEKNTKIIPCQISEYQTKAQRPNFSKLINDSDIKLRNWKEWLKDYLDNL